MMSSQNDKKSPSTEDHQYQLIEFVTKGPKKTKSIDIVPSSWVSFDQTKGRLVCKFMPPPYNAENNELLYQLVDQRGEAPESWPTYSIKIKGHASK